MCTSTRRSTSHSCTKKDLNKGAANDVGWRLHSTQQNNIILQLLSSPLRPSKAPDTCFALPPIKGKVASKRFRALAQFLQGTDTLVTCQPSPASAAMQGAAHSHLTPNQRPALGACLGPSDNDGPQQAAACGQTLAEPHAAVRRRAKCLYDELRARPFQNSFFLRRNFHTMKCRYP